MVALGIIVAAFASANLPTDISSILDRQQQCAHWAGEEPYDKARAHAIATAMTKLRCEDLPDPLIIRKR